MSSELSATLAMIFVLLAGSAVIVGCAGIVSGCRLRGRLRRLSTGLVLDGLPDPLLLTDAEGRILDANPAAARLLGRDTGSLAGARCEDLLGLDLEHPSTGSLTDRRLPGHPLGPRFDVQHTSIRRRDGRILMHACLLEDRSAYRASEDRLHALTDDLLLQANALESANATKRSFIAGCSDSLGDPLLAIMDDARALSARLGPGNASEAASFAEEIDRGARHLHALVDDIRAFERTGRERSIEPVTVDVHRLLTDVVRQMRPLATAKSLELRTDAEAGQLGVLHADLGMLRQILVNLVANAIKFTPDGGSVNVGAQRDGDTVHLRVSDTGIGIPRASREQIFQPFEQIDGSLSRRHGGTGLGLALVRRLSELHGGSAILERSSEEGSVFRVSIPDQIVPQTRTPAREAQA